MRLRLGRPSMSRYAARFDVPPADSATPLSVTFFGVSTLLLDDGASPPLLTDGFFSRPGLVPVALRRLVSDVARIEAELEVAQVRELAGVVPVHTHYDHALDSAAVADRTGALLVGGRSAMNLGRGHGLPEERLVQVEDGATRALGAFDVTFRASRHCPPDRYPGEISAPWCRRRGLGPTAAARRGR